MKIKLLTGLLLALLLAGCGAQPAPQTDPVPAGAESGYPPESVVAAETPLGNDSVDSYPPPDPQGTGAYPGGYPPAPTPDPYPGVMPQPTPDPNAPYPPPTVTMAPAVVIIDEPVGAGETTLTGSGIPGLPLTVISVSRNGEEIGSGQIGADGTFEIQVSPLESGTLIGIRPGDLAGTGVRPEALIGCGGCRDVPLIGLLVAQTVVQ